jgi:hypothetical protein
MGSFANFFWPRPRYPCADRPALGFEAVKVLTALFFEMNFLELLGKLLNLKNSFKTTNKTGTRVA